MGKFMSVHVASADPRRREESEAIILEVGTTQQPEPETVTFLLPMPEFSLGFPHLTYMYVRTAPRTKSGCKVAIFGFGTMGKKSE